MFYFFVDEPCVGSRCGANTVVVYLAGKAIQNCFSPEGDAKRSASRRKKIYII